MQNNPFLKPPNRIEKWIIRAMIVLGVLSIIHFLYWFFQPEFKGNTFLFILLAIVFLYGMLRHLYLWYHYYSISIPEVPTKLSDFKVDIFTTYFPGEPLEMVENTLRAIQNIDYPHMSYLCDEADEPYLRNLCLELGVHHITRDNRKDAKAGNINNALKKATGDICLILDPDHVPEPGILNHILPHFSNPEIGFVQIVQSYSNKNESLVAKGAAEQTFQFYGPMMLSMNTYGTVNAIGANCTFRRVALDSIGGHAPGLAEDMHTAMQLHARGWKSVYVPKVLAKGLVPETLVTYFKQQLKWSRGTFELLFRVYPKLFRNFSLRQKIHYGLLPLHYLIGLIYVFSFSIPILSLLFSWTPWTGNILFFLLMVFPVALSTLLIRAFIQKWVIEPEERGFHLIGGLLQITSWWIHFLGLFYAIINKKVPYLPTPKNEDQKMNLTIILPNLLVGILSVLSIAIGLYRDLNPFSLMMAGFALLNAGFMFFSIYLSMGSTNKNRILRSNLDENSLFFLRRLKYSYQNLSRNVFNLTRRIALPSLLLCILIATWALDLYNYRTFEGMRWSIPNSRSGPTYYGLFNPSSENGLTDMTTLKPIEKGRETPYDLISLYLAWGDQEDQEFPKGLVNQIYDKGAWPLITWEPWTNSFHELDSISDFAENRYVFKHILNGKFDNYIDRFAFKLKSLNAPVFLRFAHEYDNPAYPWSETGGNEAKDYVKAWKYIHKRFESIGAQNVIWVWNPFTKDNLKAYFPGEAYVDWIGLTILNYGVLNQDGNWHSFDELYIPFRDAFKNELPDLPVMIAEFGSQNLVGDRNSWVLDALSQNFSEIKAWVLFNSRWDKNIPKASAYNGRYLDWTGSRDSFENLNPPAINQTDHIDYTNSGTPLAKYNALGLPDKSIRGVRYNKGRDWFGSHYILTRPVLEQDFKMMKEAGINTVQIQGPSVYDYNLFKVSREQRLKVIYSFWIPETFDFFRNQESLEKLKNSILRTVERHKGQQHIVAWNLGNPVWNELINFYARPELDRQRTYFQLWFKNLCKEIKERDPNRRLFADFKPSYDSHNFTNFLLRERIPIDALGLLAADDRYTQEFYRFADQNGLAFYSTWTEVRELTGLPGSHFVIDSWQNEWESSHITFNGILDHKGRKKASYFELAQKWAGHRAKKTTGSIAIMRPATPLYPGENFTYSAKRFDKGTWTDPAVEEGEIYDWFLIKYDYWGNPLALKHMGQGTSINLTIPKDYKLFKIMLTYQKNGLDEPVISVRSSLNLPLINPL